MAKLKIAVVFGGKSNEHDVSVVSAAHVIRSINENSDRYEVICIGITKKGHWLRYIGSVEDIENGKWAEHPDNTACIFSPDPVHRGFIQLEDDGTYSNVKVDAVFPVLHGKNGEDGTIQGIFQMGEIPFVGCDLLSSACCMDKDVTHTILEAHGIKTAKWQSMIYRDMAKLEERCREMEQELGYPMYVKPANCGSSVGISKAHNYEELKAGIKAAFSHDQKVIVEQEVKGIELECAVMGNDEPFASTVGEISPANEFYDYDAKYNDEGSLTYIPARVSEEVMETVKKTAVKAYKAMGCSGLSRADFFLREDGEVILNEINTLPGHTKISMFPMLMAHDGISYAEQEDRLIKLALDRSEVDYE
ncbi:D-alanine--D-alanine ligase family protein [Ruminococcus sp.]|uniref:D-alanine--D-alanine ligase family protein n=1 Tax=Ruminococcus sp. TaxID=41978 RepID=UPI0025D0E8FE|nr:D-alanine--D-alanine ligase family protein [Ruminococcus sp.]MBQ8965832.1 D-alanine--D-alanine ligase [Ruminococcus sp.]